MTAVSSTMFASARGWTIDHFHARYEGFDRPTAERLDRVMSSMLEPALSRTLTDHSLDELYAVCIPSVDVAIDIGADMSLPDMARQWADRVAAEVAAVIESCRGSSPLSTTGAVTIGSSHSGDLVVVYRRAVDALVDLVTSVAAGDGERRWAWNQVGLWPRSTQPSGDDVALIVARDPSLAGAVVSVAGERGPLPWTRQGWQTIAAAVVAAFQAEGAVAVAARLLGRTGTVVAADAQTGLPPSDSERGLESGSSASDPVPPDPTPTFDDSRLVALIPRAVWLDASPDERGALAVLTLAAWSPSQARDPRAVAAIVAAAVGATARRTASSGTRSTSDPPADAGPASPTTAGSAGPDVSIEASNADTDEGEPIRSTASGFEQAVTDHGGVLFLIHPLRELDVVDELGGADPVFALAQLVSIITGVPVDDPVVAVISGRTAEAAGITSIDREVLDVQADRVRSWLRERLPTGLDQLVDGDPFGWIWTRRAAIDRTPGWIEANMALDSVDIRVRAAALDLDPGFVWWLGSVVRFRYA